MKTTPHRSQTLVVGGGIAGICASISAARQGSTVTLIEARNTLGGRIGEEVRLPFDLPGACNSSFPRESGLLDEIFLKLIKFNTEGTHAGQSRVFSSILNSEPRINLLSGVRTIEVNLNEKKDRIESCLGLCQSTGERHLFKSQYFIDCTGTGNLSQLAKAPGETGADLGDAVSTSEHPYFQRTATLLHIVRKENSVSFSCPDWVRVKWEDNQLDARVDWLESLNHSLVGYHHLEWISPRHTKLPTADEIAWSAWDYLKNRSPLKETVSHLAIERVSPILFQQGAFRGLGDYTMCEQDMVEGKKFFDSIAVGRSALDGKRAMLCSNRGKMALAQPFEIPLRSLYSSKIRNLLWAGEHASASFDAAPSLGHPPTAAQMGVAAGHCAAHCITKKRLPRTIAKKGHIEDFQKSLELVNHRTALALFKNEHDLVRLSKVGASSTWTDKDILSLTNSNGPVVDSCLIQFPITEDSLDGIKVFLTCENPCNLEARLLCGSSFDSNLPGECLDACTQKIDNPGSHEITLSLKIQINKVGWHFLELRANEKFSIMEVENPPVGVKISYPKNSASPGAANSYCKYLGKPSNKFPVSYGPLIQVLPPQKPYLPTGVTQEPCRPSNLPNLWTSKPTDFKYPEFLELTWNSQVEVSRITLNFDASYDLLFPAQPSSVGSPHIPSIVKDYRIYGLSPQGKSELLLEVTNNFLPFKEHIFDPICITGLELEILSTNGLDRAQIYRLCAFE